MTDEEAAINHEVSLPIPESRFDCIYSPDQIREAFLAGVKHGRKEGFEAGWKDAYGRECYYMEGEMEDALKDWEKEKEK